MKAFAACILALALFLRAAPICATPVQDATVAMMPDCEQAPTHHDEQPARKGSDAARACHACAFPPVAEARLEQPVVANAVVTDSVIEQLKSNSLKPPLPPPRAAAHEIFQQSIGV
jgi:hypothetical protein